jgi:acyl-CoA thioester hydrolase
VFGKVKRGSDGKSSPFGADGYAAARMGRRYTHRLRVRYGECDQQGVVFNAHYFAYFDHVLTEVWRDAVIPYKEMLRSGVDVVVAEARARFRAPARFEDEVDLVWWVTRLGNTAMTTRIDVMRGNELLVEGEMRHVFVDAGSSEKRPIPPEIRAPLERYLEQEPARESGAAPAPAERGLDG